MIITEALFACLREWHRHVVARAFCADDDDVIFVFSSMNIWPKCVEAPPSRDGTAALRVHTPCCRGSRLFLEEHRLKIVQLLRARSFLQTGGDRTSGVGEKDLFLATRALCGDEGDIIESLRTELHLPSCWWRQGDVVRQLLRSPRLALADLALVRYRCAAVKLVESSSSSLKVDGCGATAEDAASAAKLLLPRGSPPSFVRNALLAPAVSWLRALATKSSRGLTSGAPMSLLQVMFASKRSRQEEDSAQTNAEDQGVDLAPSAALLMTLFGYTVVETTPFDSASEAVCADDPWRRLGANISCHFCGGRPLLRVEKVPVERETTLAVEAAADKKEDTVKDALNAPLSRECPQPSGSNGPSGPENCLQEQEETTTPIRTAEHLNEEGSAPSAAVDGGDNVDNSPCVRLHHTILLSEQNDFSGHYKTCPWKLLFLSPVLADVAVLSLGKDIDFGLCGIDQEGTSLQLCFKLTEVVKMIECWRRSLHADSVWKTAYAKHPLPAALRSVIPQPADSATEAYLQELASRDAAKGDEANEESLALTPLTPLFDDRSIWESYFRVTSFLKASLVTNQHQSLPTRANAQNVGNEPLEVKESHWKAAYDAGRRCILGAVGEKEQETTAKLSQGFMELYHHALKQDASANSASSPLGSVASKIYQLLSADMTMDPQQCGGFEDGLSKRPPLSQEDHKRIQSFLNMLNSVVENTTRKAQLQQFSAEAKSSDASLGQSGDMNPKQGGPSSVKQHQQQQQARFQRSSPHQHQPRLPPSQQPHILPTRSVASEGILSFPYGGLLPTPEGLFAQQPLPSSFQPAGQGSSFAAPGRTIAPTAETVGVLDDAYMQRPSVMGQRRPAARNSALERQGGRGGKRRGGRGGNAFKG